VILDRDLNASQNILKQGLDTIPKELRNFKLVENPTIEKASYAEAFSSDSLKQEASAFRLG
jgi:transposase